MPREIEFCRYCGAGIGSFRRDGEGTCIKCNPDGRPGEHNALNDRCPIKRRILPDVTPDVLNTPAVCSEQEKSIDDGWFVRFCRGLVVGDEGTFEL